MTLLQTFCYDALQRLGAHGMVDTDTECGCHLGDFAPCGDGPYNDCQPAIKLTIPDDPDADLLDPQTGQKVYHGGKPGDWVMVPWRSSERYLCLK